MVLAWRRVSWVMSAPGSAERRVCPADLSAASDNRRPASGASPTRTTAHDLSFSLPARSQSGRPEPAAAQARPGLQHREDPQRRARRRRGDRVLRGMLAGLPQASLARRRDAPGDQPRSRFHVPGIPRPARSDFGGLAGATAGRGARARFRPRVQSRLPRGEVSRSAVHRHRPDADPSRPRPTAWTSSA